ncbi:hypothetical protein LP419_03875 [Massilia sp. H-1]|nr:hypothetical protein LP419_03875 [Massilia sp. H-1]
MKALAPVTHGEVRSAAKQLIADGDLARDRPAGEQLRSKHDFAMCA